MSRWTVKREAEDIERRRAKAPRTVAMEARFFEALSAWPRHHRIETALVALGYDLDSGRDLTPAEERAFNRILREVEQALSIGLPV